VVALLGVNITNRSLATTVEVRATCEELEALPVRLPTKLLHVIMPVPPVVAPIVNDGTLGCTFIALAAKLAIWTSAAVVVAVLGVNITNRSLATVVDVRATCEQLEALPVRAPLRVVALSVGTANTPLLGLKVKVVAACSVLAVPPLATLENSGR
jgi:hypothetical protein